MLLCKKCGSESYIKYGKDRNAINVNPVVVNFQIQNPEVYLWQ
ncbi:hypothetical protein P618_200075 [Holospora obtusa F1]|uniref:Uncharacterized protein n=1 Tax=Holospora obtusa F1 TaxID=1399147 RepID=W6TVB9_HOLOB|nr:hypothetical protein P618_200075 [Holospora obtusa F1]